MSSIAAGQEKWAQFIRLSLARAHGGSYRLNSSALYDLPLKFRNSGCPHDCQHDRLCRYTCLLPAAQPFEIKSVNSRFLDLVFRFPDELRELECRCAKLLAKQLSRGKMECRAGWSINTAETNETLDANRLQALQRLAHEVQSVFTESRGLSTADVLRWPGVVQTAALDWPALLP